MPIILHVDMDCFFAQVEMRDSPELRGKPVIIGADPKHGIGRGVVSTASYEARKYGIRSAMPISIAYKKCPDGVFLPVNYEKYCESSDRIMSVIRRFAGKMEQVSVDEAYLDISRMGNYERAKGLGVAIKKAVWKSEQLTCSVGIGQNKLIAKVASDSRKPDGLTVVTPPEVWDFLAAEDVGVLRGVGLKTKAILNEKGFSTVADLQKMTKTKLTESFGSFGEELYRQARGRYTAEIIEDWDAKSIGRQMTFEEDTDNREFIIETLNELCGAIHEDLKSQGFKYKKVTVKCRYDDFDTHTKQQTLTFKTDEFYPLQNKAKYLMESFLNDKRKIRLIGVSVSGF